MRHDYYLGIGELIFSRREIIVKTALGSCIAVILYDPVLRMGGICHYLLTEQTGPISTKYGKVAVPLLLKKFDRAGSKRRNLIASVVGGAMILDNTDEIFFIGETNAGYALSYLKEEGVHIKLTNTGGDTTKVVWFNTSTGEVKIEERKPDILRKNKNDVIF